jgi:bacterioferritin
MYNTSGDYVASKQLLDLLAKGVELELHVSLKYMWQHILVKGIEGATIEKTFRDIAITEMKHAEDLAERLAFLDGIPPYKFDPVHPGIALEEMLREDEEAEEKLVTLYKQAIQAAGKEGDFSTKRLLEDILTEEEKHLDKFSKLLVGMTSPFTQP